MKRWIRALLARQDVRAYPARKPPARSLALETLETRALLSAFVVAPTGSDSAAGTASAPWKTLQHAADMVKAGDVVSVQAGAYAGFQMGFSGQQSGVAGSPITFAAQPGAVINAPNAKTSDGIDLEGVSYITIQGFTINNPNGTITRAGIRSVTNNHMVIQNNNVDGMGNWGIFTGFSDDVLIQNNTASHSQTQHGIYVSNSGDRPTIRGNTVFGNYACGIHMNGDASMGGDGIISNALVEGNVVYDNGAAGGSAINADGVQNSVFRNNLLYNNHASGISLFMMDGGGPSTNNLVTSNTIIEASDARWDVNIVDGSTGNTVLNNVLDNRNTGHGAINIAADSLSGFRSDYNAIINNRFSPDDGNTYMTLSQWQSATGQDLHSLVTTEAALFVAPSSNNYHLLATAPAIDHGTSTSAPTIDLDGKPRPSGAGYDMGAYEYQQGTTPTTTPVATSTSLACSSYTLTAGQTLTLTATVTPASGTTAPPGTVNFLDGSTVIGSMSLSETSAVFSTSSLAVGTHALSALYSGNSAFNASTSAAASVSVTTAPTVPPPTTTTSRQVSLGNYFNLAGIYTNGTKFYSGAGFDAAGNAYSANALGTSITAGGVTFTLGAANTKNVVRTAAQNVTLPAGNYRQLTFLGAATNGVQTGTLTVTYTDGTKQTFTQTFSDWCRGSQGEAVAKTMSYVDRYDGTALTRTSYVYYYSLPLNAGKTVARVKLPNNANIKLLGMALVS